MNIRSCTGQDLPVVRDLLSKCPELFRHHDYAYLMLFRYFQELCLLAEEDVGPLGFVVGFQSTSSRLAFFLWQIGVDPSARGKGVATDLVRAAVANAKILGCVALECTITNKSSYRVFEKVAQDEGSKRSHYASLLLTQFVPLLPPIRGAGILPFDFIGTESLAFYRREFKLSSCTAL